MRILLALGALCLAPSAISAEDKAPAPKPEKKVCRREDVIGSVIPAHICLTKAEWQQLGDYYANVDQGFMDRRNARHGELKTIPQ
jgi:hypothetical protein